MRNLLYYFFEIRKFWGLEGGIEEERKGKTGLGWWLFLFLYCW